MDVGLAGTGVTAGLAGVVAAAASVCWALGVAEPAPDEGVEVTLTVSSGAHAASIINTKLTNRPSSVRIRYLPLAMDKSSRELHHYTTVALTFRLQLIHVTVALLAGSSGVLRTGKGTTKPDCIYLDSLRKPDVR